jgi:hypothetical protein
MLNALRQLQSREYKELRDDDGGGSVNDWIQWLAVVLNIDGNDQLINMLSSPEM